MLGFTDNAHEYFIKGNSQQKRKILEIISEEITYKDKHFDIKLKPIFQTIAENHYNLTHNFAKNRTLKNGTIKGVETDSTPNNRKNSPGSLGFAPRSNSLVFEPVVLINSIFSLSGLPTPLRRPYANPLDSSPMLVLVLT